MRKLTYDDLADFYKKKTGGCARIQPIDDIVDWAVQQPEIVVNEDETLSFASGAD